MYTRLAALVLLAPAVALTTQTVVKPAPSKVTTKAQWRIKVPATTSSDAMDDHGARSLPVIISADCAARFRVDRLTYSMDAGDTAAIRRAFAGKGSISSLEIVVTKLFAGRGEPPALALIQEKGATMRFSLSSNINVNAWPRKGYRLVSDFEADKLQTPKFWTRLEATCE